jgi:Cys-rich four helix bundle protein (predicted Tat secretion target)
MSAESNEGRSIMTSQCTMGQTAGASPAEALSRRSAMRAGLAATAGLSLLATAASPVRSEGEHHHHHGHDAARHKALIDVALKCVGAGEVCLDHCYKLLGTGDTSLKDCVRTVSAMLPMCAALVRLAALDAPRLKELAKLCIDVCGDCETECKKHQEHHALCRACAESCAECITACKKLIAA